jgi:hypothetical protein
VAAQFGFEFVHYGLNTLDDLEGAFASGLQDDVSAFYISGEPLLSTNMSRVMPFIAASRKPTVGTCPDWGRGGLLMSRLYGCGSLLSLFLLHRRSGYNLNRQPPRLAAQKHDAALWLNVDALIQSRVFLLPTSLIDEKPP